MYGLEWKRALLTKPLTSDADLHACIEATGGQFGYSVTQISQNVVTCNKLNLLLNKIFVSGCS